MIRVDAGTRAPVAPAIDFARARSLIADVRMGRSTLARAAAALGIASEDLPSDGYARALAVYRAYIGGVVETASPLVARGCALDGIDVDKLTRDLRPGVPWARWLCGTRPRDAWLKALTGQVNALDATPAIRREWAVQEWLHGGIIVCDPATCQMTLGIRVLDGQLEMAASLGGHRLRTHGGQGSINLQVDLPATVVAALPGVALDRLIDHPLINGAGCVVTGVDERTMWGTKVHFALAPVPWRMPWAR